jgi:N6-L-threonylcarbamoyladenine synthase
MAIYLGIETSCDETAAAVVADGRHILSNCLFSQIDLHKKFGGVVPEVAAREHLESINDMIHLALSQANIKPSDLTGIACTNGPGLIGTLLVGLSAAKSLSYAWDLPLIGVDHLIAHVCANYLDTDLEPPFLALLVSGGHSQLMHFTDFIEAKIIGQTIDDAAGEAYDKVARLLGLGYPGGPIIDTLSKNGDNTRFQFPQASVEGFNFSFSGVKTSVLRCLEKLEKPWPTEDLAASFQFAVINALVKKTLLAQKYTKASKIVLAGGVAANSYLKEQILNLSPVPVLFPAPPLCTDNAAMVAAAAFFKQKYSSQDESYNLADVTVYSRSSPEKK